MEFSYLADSTFDDGAHPMGQLEDVICRPQLIKTYDWGFNEDFSHSFRPWVEFLDTEFMRNKLAHYGLIRCNLRLKFLINASPFFHGDILVGYQPSLRTSSGSSGTRLSTANTTQTLMGISQLPHVHLVAAASRGAEMELPFFHYKNWLSTTDSVEHEHMGEIIMRSYDKLRFANGASTTARIQVQVYVEAYDVHIAGLTQVVLQSGRKAPKRDYKPKRPQRMTAVNDSKEDEYNQDGPISNVAGAVASAAGDLARIKEIAPLMRATQAISTGIGRLASAFGWSDPPVISDASPFRSEPFYGLANPDISTSVAKLTLDAKNELTVDPRTVGLNGADELSVSSICGKPSFLVSFPWSTASSSNLPLVSFCVGPNHFNRATVVSNEVLAVQATPMHHVSQMFKYWRGDIIFKFRVISTMYHKGRLRVSWDPYGNNTNANQTEVFTRIFDIGLESEFEVCVPWLQGEAFRQVRSFTTLSDYSGTLSSTEVLGQTAPYRASYDNGILSLNVLTDLTGPTEPAEVTVVCWVAGGENLEFAGPKQVSGVHHVESATFQAQSAGGYSFTILGNAFEGQSSNAETIDRAVTNTDPEADGTKQLADTKSEADGMFMVNMGERVVSLRQYIRRAGHLCSIPLVPLLPGESAQMNFSIRRQPMPNSAWEYGWFVPEGATVTSPRYNPVHWLPVTWVAVLFAAERGSFNMALNLISATTPTEISIRRDPTASWTEAKNYECFSEGILGNTINWSSAIPRDQLGTVLYKGQSNTPVPPRGMSGLSLVNARTQSGATAALPMYSQYRYMSPCCKVYNSTFDQQPDWERDSIFVSIKTANVSPTSDLPVLDMYYSAGIDYQLFFQLNVLPYTIYAPKGIAAP